MYRQMQVLEMQIYCPRAICDRYCGKFHAKSVKMVIGTSNGKGVIINNSSLSSRSGSRQRRHSLRSRRNGVQRLSSLDSLPCNTQATPFTRPSLHSSQQLPHFSPSTKQHHKPLRISVLVPNGSIPINPSTFDSQQSPPQTSGHSTALSPNAASTQAQHNQGSPTTIVPYSATSTVTLDDIIASARRKISGGAEGDDEDDAGMPEPVFFTENSSISTWPKTDNSGDDVRSLNSQGDFDEDDEKARRRQLFIQSLMDSPSSEDELWLTGKPPPMLMGDEDQEDFVELLSATKPPEDPFSNPVWRGADPLSRRRHTTFLSTERPGEDNEDNSSVDLSVADISGSQLSLNLNHLIQGQYSRGASSASSGRWQQPVEYEGNL